MNQHNLSRDIPEDIRRNIRQRYGFGCVVCGSALLKYHHFDPPFRDARQHNSDGITLLCGTCHDRIDKGTLSYETLIQCCKNPKCLQKGFARETLDFGAGGIEVMMGSTKLIDNPTIIKAYSKPLLMLEPPEINNGPCRLSASFYNDSGKEICTIVRNELKLNTENWDITWDAQIITVRNRSREISFQARLDPPRKFLIERLSMFYKGWRITVCKDGKTRGNLPDGRMWFEWDKCVFVGNTAVVVIE